MTVRGLIERGVIKPPLELERSYKGLRFTARIEENGSVTFDGAQYRSLSVAGAMARAKANNATSYRATNGWTFWHFRDERGKLIPINTLRA